MDPDEGPSHRGNDGRSRPMDCEAGPSRRSPTYRGTSEDGAYSYNYFVIISSLRNVMKLTKKSAVRIRIVNRLFVMKIKSDSAIQSC